MSLVPRGETREASPREGPPLLPDPSAPPARSRSIGAALGGTWPGRFFLGCVLLALGAIVARVAWGAGPVVEALGQWAIRGLVVVGVIGLWRLFGATRRRLLWRVRRRLTLSYVLIGVVPALLLVAFFLFAGLMTFFHVSAYLFKRGIDDIVEEAGTMADTAAIELRRAKTQEAVDAVLERKHENALSRYLGIWRHIEEFHRNRDRLAAMGRAALSTFSAHPTWERSMNRGCEFLEGLAAATHPHA